MGQSPSKRVRSTLGAWPEFGTTCDATFSDLISPSSDHLRPYQLHHASSLLHSSLLLAIPLVARFAPSPPSQFQVDSTYRRVRESKPTEDGLKRDEFRLFALELFGAAIVEGMGAAVARRVPLGAAAIAGVGMVARAPVGLVGNVVGVYALGVVATTVYLGC
ncbi:Armadillo repeat-containing protein 2 [Rhynchospora pubera]|uniref:Armadillo repeat-containing protein 2 n=1 Tax=Rhynchospora pubera TaxID=906938 RepID=A0AAV8HDT8_9POAL|nr:Armadillo repeat-containing protein 2 [Rhynchospora pubera]